jgi:hypothetical protein
VRRGWLSGGVPAPRRWEVGEDAVDAGGQEGSEFSRRRGDAGGSRSRAREPENRRHPL